MKKIIPFLLLLAGCFQMQIKAAKQECRQSFPPDTQPELYMHCIDTAMQDIEQRRAIMSQSIQQAGAGFQNLGHTTNCNTSCIGSYCHTVCQ